MDTAKILIEVNCQFISIHLNHCDVASTVYYYKMFAEVEMMLNELGQIDFTAVTGSAMKIKNYLEYILNSEIMLYLFRVNTNEYINVCQTSIYNHNSTFAVLTYAV